MTERKKIKVKKSVLKELIYASKGKIITEDEQSYEFVQTEDTSTSRWSQHCELVFKFEGSYYASSYSHGLTEIQDESPYDYDPEEIECEEVFPETFTVVRYV